MFAPKTAHRAVFGAIWLLVPGPWSEVGSRSRACARQAPNLLLRPLGGAEVRTSHMPARHFATAWLRTKILRLRACRCGAAAVPGIGLASPTSPWPQEWATPWAKGAGAG